MRKRTISFILFVCCSLAACTPKETTSSLNTSELEMDSEKESDLETTINNNMEEEAIQDFSEELTGSHEGGIIHERSSVNLEQYSDVVELELSESINADIVFTANYTLTNLKLYSLIFADTDEIKFAIEDTIYETSSFGIESAIHISTYMLELFPNLAISYIDETGSQVFYYIQFSMRSGDIILQKADEADLVKK